MFRERVSKTSSSSVIAARDLGPGISVFRIGPAGSSGKKRASEGASGVGSTARVPVAVPRAIGEAWRVRRARRGLNCEERAKVRDEWRRVENILAVGMVEAD